MGLRRRCASVHYSCCPAPTQTHCLHTPETELTVRTLRLRRRLSSAQSVLGSAALPADRLLHD